MIAIKFLPLLRYVVYVLKDKNITTTVINKVTTVVNITVVSQLQENL